MQLAVRPYATAGTALVAASMIAVTPVTAPPPGVQVRPVQLVDAYSDLFTDTVADLHNIADGADSSAISAVFSDLLTNPLGVIGALTNLDPTITTDLTPLPMTTVELTPALELGLANLGADAATVTAIHDVVGQLMSDPSGALTTLIEAPAVILNAYLNGQDNISLLDGTVTIPALDGILTPLQPADIDLNLTDLLNALGLGSLNLGQDLSGLLNDLNQPLDVSLTTLLTDFFPNFDVGGVELGTLLSGLGLGNEKVGDLLNDVPGLGGLLGSLDSAAQADLNNLTLDQLVNGLTLGNGGNLDLTDLFNALGVSIPSTDLTLGSLLGDLDPSLVGLLDSLGNLLNGDVASISVEPLGGLITELVDTVPQQILAGL